MTPKHDRGNFSVFETLYLSFYSRELYQDIARNRTGLFFPYLLLLLMFYWVPEMMNMHQNVSEFIADEAPQYVEQVPEITVTKGEASIKEAVPYTIMDKKENKPVAIIDTSGRITSLSNTPALVLLTKDKLVIRMDEKETRDIPLSDLGEITVTKKLFYNWLAVVNNLFVVVLFPFMLLISFAFHVIQVFLLTLLGGNFSKYFNAPLDFRALVRLSVVAFTPAIILEAVHAVLDIQYPYSMFISFLIAAGYLFYAVGCNSEKTLTPISRKV
jgi:hypothetical protein